MKEQTFVGPIIHSNKNGDLIIIDEAAVIVKNGIITSILPNPKPADLKIKPITRLSLGQFLIPGFIDCHFHAVQFTNIGLGYDEPLIEWLKKYTFPLEKRYTDMGFAEKTLDAVVKRTMAMGTTTICYFGSLYNESTLILAQKAIQHGQRAFIGKSSANIPLDPEYYETTEVSISKMNQFLSDFEKLKTDLVKPIITPRSALCCDMELMKKLGELAKEKDLPIQTHISENLNEVKVVSERNKGLSFTKVYDEASLLTNKTILAHGIYLSDDELNIIKDRNSAIIHCPSSNSCLKSGICDVRRLIDKGIKVGLGTDVAAGQSSSILESMKAALTATNNLSTLSIIKSDVEAGQSKSLLELMKSAISTMNQVSFTDSNYRSLDYKEVFHLATLGGATCLSLEDKIGNFEVGKQFDALLIDLNTSNGPLDNLVDYSLEEQLQRFIYSGDDRNIVQVYVCGRKVK